MADIYNPPASSYPSPLKGYEHLEPLSDERTEDGKSLKNPQAGVLSPAYETFVSPLDTGRRGGFDVHIYYMQSSPEQTKYARELWERIRREFPELRIYTFWDKPIGPHPMAMFEVNLFTPAQFGAFIPWLTIWRGPLSALIHPNTTEDEEDPSIDMAVVERRNHSQRATWMGEKIPLDFSLFEKMSRANAAAAAAAAEKAKQNGQ